MAHVPLRCPPYLCHDVGMTLSTEAKAALINTNTSRQGTLVQGSDAALIELFAADYVGMANGLTRKGSIARDRIMSAQLEMMFG